MKRILFLGVGSALVFAMSGVSPAQADGGPHRSTAATVGGSVTINDLSGAGRCAGCHRAHTAKAEYLLKDAQPALCFSCHGTGAPGSTTDVVNGTGYALTTPGALRGGGFDNARINSAGASKTMTAPVAPATKWGTSGQTIPVLAAPVTSTSKHQIDGLTAGIAYGNGAIDPTGANVGKSITLECGSCHDPHGNGNYRILKPIPVDSGAATAVVIPDAGTKNYQTTNYWLAGDSNVAAGGTPLTGTPKVTDIPGDGYIQNVAAWCTTCHTRYMAGSGSYKTDSGDATFKYRHRSDANYKAGAANCITCHVSHGSNAGMTGSAATVPLPGAATGTADSKLLRVNNRGTCVMCHNV